MVWNTLSTEEQRILAKQGTEAPFSGKYDAHFIPGTYLCRRCNSPLFDAKTKFDAGCGWPAFDDHIPGAVKQITDADGYRTEIRCAHCDGHLGHVFSGEHLTKTDIRHCVNSLSLQFVAAEHALPPLLDQDTL